MGAPPAVLAIDQGTTGSRAIVFGPDGRVLARAYREFRQHYPAPGLVEHDAEEIWDSTAAVARRALASARLPRGGLAAVGLANQRETIVLWDAATGRALGRAIVWQDRRTAPDCARLKARGLEPLVRRRTGLVLDPYFSATKLAWRLERDAGLRRRAAAGRVRFGTIDSWLLWKLTGGRSHATDYTNASRTLLFDIHRAAWDDELCRLFRVPSALLPQALPSGSRFGEAAPGGPLPAGVPIHALLGDQQAALFGQGCWRRGQAKNTYGTGCFVVMQLGARRPAPAAGLLTTLACDAAGRRSYALEGSVFVAGAAIQWLRDGLGLLASAGDSERLARSVPDSGGVVFVPALTGLGAPYWAPRARGCLSGLTRGTTAAHLVRAALEAAAHQTADVVERMSAAAGRRLPALAADGGMTANAWLMQLQADLLGAPVRVARRAESTAWGAALLAGRACGAWDRAGDAGTGAYRVFRPRRGRAEVRAARAAWARAVDGVLRA